MRRRAKVDANQASIVAALRQAGFAVRSTAEIGGGFPDLICAKGSVTILLEVKDGAKVPSARRLTPLEAEFRASWPGLVYVVQSPEEAVERAELAVSLMGREVGRAG
jgi:hypothetical protein